MKKCPYCGSELEENARFCLYCMKSLDKKENIQPSEKNRKKLGILVISVLVCLGLTVWGAFSLFGGDESQDASDSYVLSDASEIGEDAQESVSDNSLVISEDNPWEYTYKGVTYKYRMDDTVYYIGNETSINEEDVVIEKVLTPSEDGVYDLPETINGKDVIAIDAMAFCDETVRDRIVTVYIPENVKHIRSRILYYCYNLKDVYIRGEILKGFTSEMLPPLEERNETITIHCSTDCSDNEFRYVRTYCELYDLAEWEEWNG